VTGYRRGRFARDDPLGLSTTYPGVVPESGTQLNAIAYRVEVDELAATDRRESLDCREDVPLTHIKALV
jgi:hypothetical protein